MKLMTLLIKFLVIPPLVFLSLLILSSCGPNQQQLEKFASCLTEKGTIIYGASWCPYCTEQKDQFGAAFSKINYMECSVEETKCTEEGIEFLPTWKFADGSTQTGVMTFSELAEKTGCMLK